MKSLLLLLTCALLLHIMICGKSEDKFCPLETAVIASDPGCETCLCCRYAETDEYLVRCDHANLTTIPPLPVNTTELWLYGNNISRIHTFQHLPSLSTLKLSDCRTSENLRWRADCVETAVVLSDQALINLPSLQYLHIYINSHDQLQFLHPGINISELVIACEGELRSNVQQIFSKINVTKLISYNCGFQPKQELSNVAVIEIEGDSSSTELIDLPNTELTLRVSRLYSSDCLNFTKLRVKSLKLSCKAQLFNITEDMFGNGTEVGSLSLSIEAFIRGCISTLWPKPVEIDSLYLNFHFYDPYYEKVVHCALRHTNISNFKMKTSSQSIITSNDLDWISQREFTHDKFNFEAIAHHILIGTVREIFREIIHSVVTEIESILRHFISKRTDSNENQSTTGQGLKINLKKIKQHLSERLNQRNDSSRVGKALTHSEKVLRPRQYTKRKVLKNNGIYPFDDDFEDDMEMLIPYVGKSFGPYIIMSMSTTLKSFQCESCPKTLSLDEIHDGDFLDKKYFLHGNASLRQLRIVSHGRSQIKFSLNKLLNDYPKLESIMMNSLDFLDVKFELSRTYHQLQHIELSDTRAVQSASLTRTNFTQLPNLRSINFDKSFRNISVCSLEAELLETPDQICFTFSDLTKLERLSYTDNNAQFLGKIGDILAGLVHLQALNLRGNQLDKLRGNALTKLLEPVSSSLIHLDLSNNKIMTIPKNTFSNFRRLKRLNLRGNKLNVITADLLSDSPLITYLDVSINELQILDPDLIQSKSYLRVFNFSTNMFRCDCALRGFRDWVNEHKTTILMNASRELCFNSDKMLSTDVFMTTYTMPWVACDNHGIIVKCFIVVVCITATACLTYLLYYYRYDMVYLWFLRSRRRKNYEPLVEDYEFDVFLSYCQVDEDIALDIFYRLERDEDARFRVAIHDRDFTPGWSISENIAHCVKHSRMFIPLISRRYLHSEWAQYELEMAKYRSFKERRNMLIPVFIEDIPRRELSDTLQAMVRRINYLQWPDNTRHREMDVFFKRLKMSLGWEKPKRGTTASA